MKTFLYIFWSFQNENHYFVHIYIIDLFIVQKFNSLYINTSCPALSATSLFLSLEYTIPNVEKMRSTPALDETAPSIWRQSVNMELSKRPFSDSYQVRGDTGLINSSVNMYGLNGSL